MPALLLMVEVLLALDDRETALEMADHLKRLAQQTQSQQLLAQAELAQGRVSLYAGNAPGAKEKFNAALAHLQAYEQSLLAGRVRLRMAQTLVESDPPGAVVWAKAALATFERMGAARDAAEAAAFAASGKLGETHDSQK